MTLLRWSRGCRWVQLSGHQLLVLTEEGEQLFQGPAYPWLSEALKAGITEEEIYAQKDHRFRPLDALFALERLRQKKCVQYVANTMHKPLQERGGANISSETSQLHICAVGNVDKAELERLVDGVGAQYLSDISNVSLSCILLVLTEHYLHPMLDEINRICEEAKQPWLLGKAQGKEFWRGPLFVPGQTGCWTCLASRYRGYRPFEYYIQRHPTLSSSLHAAGPAPLHQDRFLTLVADAHHWSLTGRSPLEGRLVTNLPDGKQAQSTTHHLVWQPQCDVCGIDEPHPIQSRAVQSASYEVPNDANRTLTTAQTLQALSHHISPITGLVPALSLANEQYSHPEGFFLYQTRHPMPAYADADHHKDWLSFAEQTHFHKAFGAGWSQQAARVSALCEAIERHAGIYTGREVRQQASFQELGPMAIRLNDCMLYSETQFAQRQQTNASGDMAQYVPYPLPDTTRIDWSPLWSLTHQRQRWLPTAYCYYHYPQLPVCTYAFAHSNGCAAGMSMAEASLHGLLELIERDAISIWWYNRLQLPKVPPSQYDAKLVDLVREHMHHIGRKLWFLDLTTDLGIPVCVAVSSCEGGESDSIMMGFGAHLDMNLAVQRALTELLQVMPSWEALAAQPSAHHPSQRWLRHATLAEHAYLVPSQKALELPMRQDDALDSPEQALQFCVTRLQRAGIEVLVLDQTRPDIGTFVVRVVAPGLRHMWPRFAPGRLFQVPVLTGRVGAPCKEDELNPEAMFM